MLLFKVAIQAASMLLISQLEAIATRVAALEEEREWGEWKMENLFLTT